ncbi:MAG: hypothetical protein F6K58_25525 [Symploca sp. SIO2E9]|nr:hypothetical protein [Symploca sp. SIO2E9]
MGRWGDDFEVTTVAGWSLLFSTVRGSPHPYYKVGTDSGETEVRSFPITFLFFLSI